jgi:hypothetical protein
MSETQSPAPKRPKGRSPSYPAINLGTAIDRVSQFHQREQQHPTAVATLARHWGYKSINGPASLALAALKKFGLVEDEGTGPGRTVRVSDLAVTILRHPDETRRRAAIQDAALRPAIHRELWEQYGANPPSNESLNWELTRNRGFTETGASEFIPEYHATIAFAQLADGATVRTQTPAGGSDDGADEEDERPPSSLRSRRPRHLTMTEGTSTYTIPLMGGASVVVEGEFPITERDWAQLMAVLGAMKPGLVSDNARQTATSEED